jgi:hypothetical protein
VVAAPFDHDGVAADIKTTTHHPMVADGPTGADRSTGRSPLPAFIPSALFSELNLPELEIHLERKFKKREHLPFIQGLKEFAPGRISKRYAVYSDNEADWLIPNNFVPAMNCVSDVDFEIEQAFGDTWQPECIIEYEGQPLLGSFARCRCLRARCDSSKISPRKATRNCTGIPGLTRRSGRSAPIPAGPWTDTLRSITFFTHQNMTPLDVTRYATHATASLRNKTKQQAHVNFRWVDNGEPVGVGVRQWVDGARLRFTLPPTLLQRLRHDPVIQRALRTLYFQHRIKHEPRFEYDTFTADWIYECYLAAVTRELATQSSLADSIAELKTPDGRRRLTDIADTLFQAENIFENSEDGEDDAESQELQQHLRNLFKETDILKWWTGTARS